MSRILIPFFSPDLSTLTRQLGSQLRAHEGAPSHLELMNMLARAAAFRNVQHLRAAHAAQGRLDAVPAEELTDYALVERALRCFDGQGRLEAWSSRRPVQVLCLWALWAALPAETDLHERAVNAHLATLHSFGDPALLRRELSGLGLVERDPQGTRYRRIERRPPPEARDLIRRIGALRHSKGGERDVR